MPSQAYIRALSGLNFIPPLTRRFLDKDAGLASFYSYASNEEGVKETLRDLSYPPNQRKALCAALEEQMKNLQLSGAQRSNLEALTLPETVTVTTGHQCCLFTGPLYFTIKILNTVRLCEDLSRKFSGKRFVPVFWMHTEDHDLEEIDHIYLFEKKYSWDHSGEGSAGKLVLRNISLFTDTLRPVLEKTEYGKELLRIIHSCYRDGENLGDATRKFVQALFGKYGVLILDPAAPELKRTFVPILLREIKERFTSRSLTETNHALKKAGARAEVNPREINIFYLGERRRERIEPKEKGFQTISGDQRWTPEEIEKEIREFPERFSPNVALRAVYQQFLLPNIACVGGSTEIAYWLQFKGLLKTAGVSAPLLIVRNSVFPTDASLLNKWEAMGADPQSLLSEPAAVLREIISKKVPDTGIDSAEEHIYEVMGKLAERIAMLDPSLKPAVLAEAAKMKKALDALREKINRSLSRREEDLPGRVQRIHNRFFPGGKALERTENFMHWYLTRGPGFFDTLLENLEAFPTNAMIITLKENE